MSRKRRVFDMDMPEEAVPAEDFPAGKDLRRGPMATAISETVESTKERARIESEIRAENDALAEEHVRLKRAGLITDLIPLDFVVADKLIRDRADGPDQELGDLVISIRDLGLSNPIRVEPREDGRYELIQGWRRLAAYRALLAETGDAGKWGAIPAGIAAKGEALEALYRRMVDENMVRKDISFAEMAQLALSYAKDPQTEESDPEKAVALLFKSAGYQKRSYIRAFIKLVEELGGELRHSQDIPRALGLALVTRLQETPNLADAIIKELSGWHGRTSLDELDVLRRFADGYDANPSEGRGKSVSAERAKAKTTFQLQRPQGMAKCIAANGRLEIRLGRDFSAIERRKLEAAMKEFLDCLD